MDQRVDLLKLVTDQLVDILIIGKVESLLINVIGDRSADRHIDPWKGK